MIFNIHGDQQWRRSGAVNPGAWPLIYAISRVMLILSILGVGQIAGRADTH